jgi:hypothetical protein
MKTIATLIIAASLTGCGTYSPHLTKAECAMLIIGSLGLSSGLCIPPTKSE